MSRCIWVALAALMIAGCAGNQAFLEGRRLIESGDVEQGLARVQEAAKLEPGNQEYRAYYFRQRDLAVQRYLALAENARGENSFDRSEETYKRALALDADNARAKTGLEAVRMDRRHRALLVEAEDLLQKGNAEAARAKAREILAENSTHRDAQALLRRIEQRGARAAGATPQLSAALRKSVTLEFRDASLRSIFEIIAKHSGLNFIFDRDVRPDLRATVFVKNTTIEDVIRYVLVSNQLERKVLNENTLLVYPNTPAKIRDYRELVVRSFYLANADVKQTANMIRALVKTRDLYVDEKLNLLVIRDTPEAVRVAERLVANQDLGEPEVMLEVEVLEVGTTLLTDLGIQWPSSLSSSLVGAAGTPGTLTLPEWQSRSSSLVRLTVSDPLLILNLKKQDGRTNLLANPRIRVKNREKAKVHIGDKVPVITTTTTATGFAAESVSYLDVGLKLEVEPNVFLENDVGIKVGLEVSSITNTVRSSAGTLTYQIGTRNAATALRLRDGETQVLAGLISDEDRRTANKVPGLGDLPIVGRLFSSNSDTANKTEIVLLITPRVVRNLARPDIRLEEFSSGTEALIGAEPLTLPGVAIAAGEGAALALSAPGAPSTPGAPGSARLTLQAPSQVAAGQEFTIQLGMETEAALRNGALSFSFDPSQLRFVRAEPGELLAPPGGDLAFRANAAENLGRLSLNFESKADIKGSGVAARLVFQVVATASGNPSVRLEALTVTDESRRVLPAQPPEPATLTITR
jgi:general secretion pathway protein D